MMYPGEDLYDNGLDADYDPYYDDPQSDEGVE